MKRYLKYLNIIIGLYLFVLSLSGLKESWEILFYSGDSESLIQRVLLSAQSHPFLALFSGLVITSLIQSSSASIVLIMTMLSSGAITLESGIYFVLGANLGTTVTNALVGLAHSNKSDDFKKVVPAALIDDIYKLLMVIVFFFLEWMTGIFETIIKFSTENIYNLQIFSTIFGDFPNFLGFASKPLINYIINIVTLVSSQHVSLICGILFFILLIISLKLISNSLQILLATNLKSYLDQRKLSLFRTFILGFVSCWLLQSSSIAISLTLPLVAKEILKLKQVFYFSLGAALATTCDASQIISYISFGQSGLKIGLVHILLNLSGVLLFTFTKLERLPIKFSQNIGEYITHFKYAHLAFILYILILFYMFPLSLIMIFKNY